ncbi:hypothetical protein AVEN_146907-1 [Araneus ventricosus]|uniref:Uncharacterized protein n=1 Tax=Araneus ventricosus TaxID=182803 RepID=A0A4Y2CKI6_ARAVE|nr:hypothetical protein AVEN_146907-1 [Araneus ventricosus]
MYVGLVHIKSDDECPTSSRWYGAEVWRKESRIRCPPPNMTMVQNDERPRSLVVRSRLRGQMAPGPKPDSTEESPWKLVWSTLNPPGPNVLPLVWRGSLEGGKPNQVSSS